VIAGSVVGVRLLAFAGGCATSIVPADDARHLDAGIARGTNGIKEVNNELSVGRH
jgi:hypothetical protein